MESTASGGESEIEVNALSFLVKLGTSKWPPIACAAVYRQLLRDEIGHPVSNRKEVEDEMRYLFDVVTLRRTACVFPVTFARKTVPNAVERLDMSRNNTLTVIAVLSALCCWPTPCATAQVPQVVKFEPPNGAADVSPDIKELRVTFDIPMGGGFSWCGGGPTYPDSPDGQGPRWTEDQKTCVLPVSLKPGHSYEIGINCPCCKNFQSAAGIPIEPLTYTFSTRGGAATTGTGAGTESARPQVFSAELAGEAFDKLWRAFDQDYAMFTLRSEVDWQQLREQYRPKALAATSTPELAAVCAEMLSRLRDLHVWLKNKGANVPVFNRPRSANANPAAVPGLIGSLHQAGRTVRWAVTSDQIGYLIIDSWSDDNAPSQCDEALSQMRQTRGLIVDVRLNGGGSEDLAGELAGRFLEQSFVYAYSQFRNGPRHEDLTRKMPRQVGPRGPWRYDRPVLLLIGQKCMSSNESFVAMMSGDRQLVTMGDHTCGSSGNPKIVDLPLGLTVSVPQWIDYLPDGTPLDERGFQPQVPFQVPAGGMEGQRDDLLAAALARLRQNAATEKGS